MRSVFAAFAAAVATVSTADAEQIWLTMDQVRPYELETAANQIVVGNPAIADVTVHDKNRIFLYGKAPGMTNMYLFDESGKAIDNLIIRVRSTGTDMLTMHRGVNRTTYNCTSQCEATVTVGDDQKTFGEVSTQVSQRGAQAQGGN